MPILYILLGAFLGWGAIEMAKDTNKNENKKTDSFWVFIRAIGGKYHLQFYTKDDAEKLFNSIVKNKTVTYKTLVEGDESEAALYKKGIAEKWNKEDGINYLKDEVKVEEVAYGYGDKEFSSKEL